jgi:hypothetical protein
MEEDSRRADVYHQKIWAAFSEKTKKPTEFQWIINLK